MLRFTTPGGAGPLTGPLTWGQRSIWPALVWLGEESHVLNLRYVLAVPPGRSVQDVADAIGTLVQRHHGLVTRFPHFATDAYQEVARHGTIPLPVHAAAAGEAERVAAEVCEEAGRRPFHHEVEWPVRFALVLADGAPRQLAMVFSHLLFDGEGVRIVLEELGLLFGGGDLPPVDGTWSPLTLAEHEQGARERARSAAAMRYWRTELLESPHTIFDVPMLRPESPRFRRLRMTSPALAVAAGRFAKEHRCSTSAAMLAAVAAILGYYTGHARMALWLIASNRWRPEVARTITKMTEPAICSVTLGDRSFGDFARATWKQALVGYHHAAYDPADWRVELESAQRLRGVHINRSIVFNDVRWTDGWPQAPQVTGTESTSVELVDQWDTQADQLFISVLNSEDSATVDVEVDTAFLPDRVGRQLLTGMEALLVRAAARPVSLDEVGAITGIAPVVRGEDWVQVHGAGWVRPVEVANLVAAVPGVTRCAVFTDAARLVAYLVADRPQVTPAFVHDRVCSLCDRRTDVMAPQHYVLCAGPPADDSHAAWQSMPVIVAGGGRC